jgi:murein L,D-transpeptidase YcbB/YkuD
VLCAASSAAAAPGGPFAEQMAARLELATASGRFEARGERLVEPSLVAWLYEASGHEPIWTQPNAVRALMEWIARAETEGLDPEDYHRRTLTRLAAGPPDSVADAVDRELLLSDAFVALAVHLRTGKAHPRRLFRTWNYEPNLADAPDAWEILERIRAGEVAGFLEEKVPRGSLYPRLRAALARYRAIEAAGGWPDLPSGATLHPGDHDPRVRILRERLRLTGVLDAPNPADPEFFDPALEEAVRDFQRRHLLDVDGVVGRATRAALNVPVEARIRQIRVNMERLRWVYHDLPEAFLGVDLAGFDLHLWKDHGPAWSSAVQVGKPYHQTPVFRDVITYVEINPTWTVPMSITRRELAPELLKDPIGYLEKKNMELLTPSGEPVDPRTVDWSGITARRFPFVLRQRPGPDNALGRIKFMFPNKYNVYLHDTPSKQLFSRTRRAFSHGCIRVQKPLELGELLLRPNGPEWTRARIQELIDSGKTRRVTLARPMPVLILYLTAVPDLVGDPQRLQFRPDFYERDAKVLRALDAPPVEKGAALLTAQRKAAEAAPR